ncbi:MAG: hypothetical protein NT126_05845 [Bacteroidetes bacterium]|nr:hypothetical protein [Bacteroidota bacterium]
MKKSIRSLFLISCLFLFSISHAQQVKKISPKKNPQKPAWIKMIDDPAANYFEAVKAYDAYWKHHVKPVDEEELMGEGKEAVSENEREKDKEKKLSPAEKNEQDLLRYQCKRFENWQREVFPFVQPDGRILSQDERNKIWNDQQEQLKKQEGK